VNHKNPPVIDYMFVFAERFKAQRVFSAGYVSPLSALFLAETLFAISAE